MILYTPNALKSCRFTYPIKNLIETMDTRNETIIPMASTTSSVPVKERPNFKIFKRLAPNMTGIPRKNENSADTVLEHPIRIPPTMVAPERDVPGIRDNT